MSVLILLEYSCGNLSEYICGSGEMCSLEGTLDLECLAGCQNPLSEYNPTCMLMLRGFMCHFMYLDCYFIYLALVSYNNIS